MTREEAIKWFRENPFYHKNHVPFNMAIKALEQEPRCKECKWWKDSDSVYRRGCRAESKCPINRKEVFEGSGYCYLFEQQESEE
ncbi:MAG: hypothetical protein J6U56_05445 [Spirochaetia bacterium]|nr:hypothetical protein [Spirochaetia bacterium]